MLALENRIRIIITNPHVVALVTLIFLWVVFFWRLYTPVLEDRWLFSKGDFTVHYFAFSSYQAERMREGDIPLWNPYNNAGSPFAADPQSLVFYPPRWFSIAVSSSNGWTIADLQREVAAHYLLVSLLMYLFVRVTTGRNAASLIGSVVFTYGGYLTGYPMLQVAILYSAAWLPLILLGIHLSTTSPRWTQRGLALGGLGLGLSILGGHPQTNLHLAYLSLAYLLFMGYHRHCSIIGIIGRVLALCAIGGLIGLVQLWSAFEFAQLSTRINQYTYLDKSSGFAIVDTLQLIYPRLFGAWSPLYVGVAGLVLALGAMLRRTPQNLFWIGVALVSLFVAFGNNSIVYDIFYLFVPGMGIFRQQERFAIGVSFSLAMLAAYQVEWLTTRATDVDYDLRRFYLRRFQRVIYGHAVLSMTVLAVFVVITLQQGDAPQTTTTDTLALIALISVLVLLWQRWQALGKDNVLFVSGVLLVLVMVDLFTFGTRSENFVPYIPDYVAKPALKDTLAAPDPQDIRWYVDGGDGLAHYGTYFRIPDIYGTSPLYLESVDTLRDIPAERLWEVLAVRYATLSTAPPESATLTLLGDGVNYSGEAYQVYELDNPRPYAHLVYRGIVAENHSLIQTLMADPFINLRETAIVAEELPFTLPESRPADAAILDLNIHRPEYLEIDVDTSENALLTLPIASYPGWQAEVNGRQVEIVETYGGLMGIPIRGNEKPQRVQLYFRPTSIRYGGAVSVLVAMIALGYVVAGTRRDSQPTPASL